ncbi:MAG: hypothetical protein K0R00_4328 [Herbinix sp.]|nr:hypothetical protein [Herbinix sp.]
MKNKIIIITFILIVTIITISISNVTSMAKQAEDDTQDILYQDVIITALTPTINIALADYYKNIFRETPLYDFSFIKILNIERPNGNRTAYFIVKIEVTPFFGPHIAVGKDILSIELSYPGTQILTNFEHIEDYPLPEHYKDLYLH